MNKCFKCGTINEIIKVSSGYVYGYFCIKCVGNHQEINCNTSKKKLKFKLESSLEHISKIIPRTETYKRYKEIVKKKEVQRQRKRSKS